MNNFISLLFKKKKKITSLGMRDFGITLQENKPNLNKTEREKREKREREEREPMIP